MPQASVPQYMEIDPLVTLLAAAAFLSGFILVALQVINVAFERIPTGTQAPITGVPVTWFKFRGAVPDGIRNRILFIVAWFQNLLFMYLLTLAVCFATGLVAPLKEKFLSAEIVSFMNDFGLQNGIPILASKVMFVFLWLFLMFGIHQLLRARINLGMLS